MEMETINKRLKETTLEVENLKKKSGVTYASISNRLQEMEERISEAKDNIENMDKTVREDAKAKNLPQGNQDNLATLEFSSPITTKSRMPNTPEKKDSDRKSYLKMMLEILKQNGRKSRRN